MLQNVYFAPGFSNSAAANEVHLVTPQVCNPVCVDSDHHQLT